MPRQSVPSYRLHKPSGQARTIILGRHIYLGKYNLPESTGAPVVCVRDTVMQPVARSSVSRSIDTKQAIVRNRDIVVSEIEQSIPVP